jgi:DNA-binding NtrC family response regulator
MIIPKVLFVDDDCHVLSAFQRLFRNFFVIDTALGVVAGLKVVSERGPFSVIVSDLKMPGMDGIQFLSQARKIAPESIGIILTGNA